MSSTKCTPLRQSAHTQNRRAAPSAPTNALDRNTPRKAMSVHSGPSLVAPLSLRLVGRVIVPLGPKPFAAVMLRRLPRSLSGDVCPGATGAAGSSLPAGMCIVAHSRQRATGVMCMGTRPEDPGPADAVRPCDCCGLRPRHRGRAPPRGPPGPAPSGGVAHRPAARPLQASARLPALRGLS